jgi:hypothetical protein
MHYKDLVKTSDQDLLKKSRQLSFLIGLNLFSNIHDPNEKGDDAFALRVSNKMFPFLKFMEETQWEILYFLETGEEPPEYLLSFLNVE